MGASNPFNVSVPVIDFDKPDAPTSQTYHGVAIMVNNQIVGRLQNWNVTGVYTRTITPVRELNFQTFGRIVDLVPGNNEPYQASASRVEVWNDEFEKACGYSHVWVDLIDQTYPFTVKEVWKRGNEIYRISEYRGCWFSEKNLQDWSVDGDARVMVQATIMFVSKSITFAAKSS